MKKYRRWILILTALTVFVVVKVDGLRGTSLIHAGKNSKLNNQTTSSSSTTTTPASSLDEVPEDDDGPVDANGTKIVFTGIPQIDYVWDPNLPRELNGFNLSTYPFLDSMPAEEDIGFDCDDKINGFYASIKFGCQLYHHCLYGVRSDFICANFTAFDQKTFICHFVSEVDCKNSHRYWSRNDDLYKATTQKSTTSLSGLVPLIDRGFYNRTRYSFLNSQSSTQNNNNNNSPQNNNNDPQKNSEKSSSSNKDAPASTNNSNNRNINNKNTNNDDFDAGRPARPLRRPPFRRRRPYDYYEDEYADDVYEERDRRRNRPRQRRPMYDDYDNRRPETRRPYYDDFDDYDYEYDRRPMRNRNRSEARNSGSRYDERRAGGTHNESRRRPAYEDDRRRTGDRRQQQDDKVRGEERRFSDDDRRDRYDDNKNYNNRRNNPLDENKRKPTETGERKQEETVSDEKLVKPAGTGSIFDRKRPMPKINRPVPLSEKNKFAYKATESPNANIRDGGKNEDANASYEYDDISVSSSTSSTTSKSSAAPSTTKAFSFPKLKQPSSLSTTVKTTTTLASVDDGAEVYEYVYEDEDYDTAVTPTQKPIIEISSIKPKDERASLYSSRVRNENIIASSLLPSTTTTTAAPSPDSFRLNRYKNDNSKESIQQQAFYGKPLIPSISPNGNANSRKFANKQTFFESPVTQEIPSKKFSFQNSYNNRNLDNKQDTEPIADDKEQLQKSTVKVIKRPFLPSRGGSPYKGRGLQPVGILAEQQHSQEKQEDEKNVSYNDGNRKQTETHKLTLEDLYEEYDVDLNDALNPMLKPLTSSRNVQGFSSRSSTVDVNDKDHPQNEQNSKILSKTDHVLSKPAEASEKATTTPLPEYYEDELEYDTYVDDAA